MRILVIDDEKPTLSMFNLFLTAYGYDVYTAEDGESGLELFREKAPAIVFTDIKMPGMDGLEVLANIREQNAATQVIIITGHGDMERAVQALDLDASDFINKPVEREALDSALARAENRAQLRPGRDFSWEAARNGDCLTIRVTGKLSESARDEVERLLALDAWAGAARAVFRFDDGFSINRSGINHIMALMQEIRRKQIDITLQGLSYNYIRFFNMAGMEKLARMES